MGGIYLNLKINESKISFIFTNWPKIQEIQILLFIFWLLVLYYRLEERKLSFFGEETRCIKVNWEICENMEKSLLSGTEGGDKNEQHLWTLTVFVCWMMLEN